MNTNKIFWILTITVFIGLLVPTLIQDGMFLDGVTYSSIAKNMANGIGDFWKPHYTKTLYPNFYEHPPLVFGIQSLFFKILGDGFYVERIYTLLTAIITIIGIILCWRLFSSENSQRHYSWLPVLLWISTPLVFWGYRNNILENTMGVFTIFSIYFISKSLITKRIIWLIPGSVLIVMAFLSKGPAGLFPLVAPIIFTIIFKPNKPGTSIIYCLSIFLIPCCLLYALTILIPESRENISYYFNQQLLPAINGQREITTNNRFSIILALTLELTLPIALFLFFTFIQWLKDRDFRLPNKNAGWYFLLIGISASIPLIISLKQRKFYLIPSIPYYVLSVSFIIIPYLKNFLEGLSSSVKAWIMKISYSALILIIVFSIFRFGTYSRDEQKLNDVYSISEYISKGTIIGTTPDICQDWGLVAYMSRIGNLSLENNKEHDYLLILKSEKNNIDLIEKFNEINLGLKQYKIYKKKSTEHTINPDGRKEQNETKNYH